ncbi:O-antigen ligase family protein [Colwellia sp. 1_MG-2023]|uniref:O-antigen ligase family protein n=1 Tax=Colwellia sp. 1_MG-2023 TaxID=3062649 RepID=UPI0026E2DB1C|nr:O-antigen ligase family protein [Colwellia sp. 1_MG-2023]MDO6444976.1 O-antigen ligase family protein [Colwellia sp. 1_MG-2023]
MTKNKSEKASVLSYLTGIYLFFFYMQASLRWPAFEAIRFHFVFGLILTILCGFKLLSAKKEIPTRKFKRFNVEINPSKPLINCVFLFLFILGIYSVVSYAQAISLDVYNRRVIKFALISFFIVVSVDKVKDLEIILIGLLLAWFKIGSEGFIGWATGSLMWENQGVQRLHGASAFVGHPNSFSAFGVGCLAFALYLYKGFESKWLKLMMLGIIVFSFIIIVFTGSRSGYVAVLLAAIYLFFQMKRGKLKVFFSTLVLLIALAPLIPEQYYERFESIYTGKEAEGNSSNTRMIIMTDALKIYTKYPLGIGVQAFSTVRMDMFGRFQNIHMLYLEVLTNIGPIGFIVFCVFILRLMRLNRLNIEKTALLDTSQPNYNKMLFLNMLSKGILAYLIMRLIFGLFAMDLYEPHWWLLLGLVLAVNKLIPTCISKETS